MFLLSACSGVKFSANDAETTASAPPPGGGGPTGTPIIPTGGLGSITCNPMLNGSTATVTLSTTSTNPTLTANCNPSGVNYSWTVTLGGSPVTINGLTGSSSQPDFVDAGPGTYQISLTASAVGYTNYVSPNPLTVVVQPASPTPTQSLVCNPTINGNLTSITLSTTNPTIAANCTPSTNVGYVWTTQTNGSNVTISGLVGSSSTPDFLSAGPGTYSIWLNASLLGYNSYTSTASLKVIVPSGGGGGGTPQHDTDTVSLQNNKLDVLVVIDDSNSMLKDNQRLAARLEGFINDLSAQGFDWQMCATLTNAQQISSSDPNSYWGASNYWVGNTNSVPYILNSSVANPYQIFVNTINAIGAGWAGTEDERGIKAAYWHLWNGEPGVTGTSGCYRSDANLAVVLISNEDERSIGNDQTQLYYQSEANKPLESDDLPSTYLAFVQQIFGTQKHLSFNSIIVRPGDTNCMAQEDAEGYKSHFGTNYAQLAGLTGGYVGSICDTDYSSNLNYFKNSIVRSQASFALKCAPVGGQVKINVTPNYSYTASVDSTNHLNFSPAVPAGSTVDLQYTCP